MLFRQELSRHRFDSGSLDGINLVIKIRATMDIYLHFYSRQASGEENSNQK